MSVQAIANVGRERIHPLTGALLNPRQHRSELAAYPRPSKRGHIEALYDAASGSDEFSKYWQNSDAFDADSSHSRPVRERMVQRSRYEVANNGYADGIAQTYATHLVGKGPELRMQTASQGFNRLVQNEWYYWCKAVRFRQKLWCMAHAKHVDGEAFGILRRNAAVNHAVPFDLVLTETEQVQTPMLGYNVKGYIDGIRFDDYGNPIYYDVLKEHPGTNTGYFGYYLEPEQVPAKYVAHWYRMRRPGQHRGVPECASTLQVGAAARRWREATLASAETAAEFSVLLKTMFQPDEMDAVSPMSTMDIQKRMMTALPQGWDATQMEARHPNATYESFHKQLVNEMARAKNMPYNVAACDSSGYNYSSGRLDHQTYHGALDVDRADCDDQVLDVIFRVWFERAVRAFGWLGGDPDSLTVYASVHTWDWPKHQVADVETEANATRKSLESGALGLAEHYSKTSRDYEDELEKEAESVGLNVQQMRLFRLFQLNPVAAQAVIAATMTAADNSTNEGAGNEQR